MSTLSGKVALITGGSSGIGLATAKAFLCEGASVAIASRDQTRGEAALRVLHEESAGAGEVIWIQTDVSQASQVEAMVAQTLDTFGRLDYAFNNGGSGGNGGWLAEINEEDWDKTVDGYLKSVFLCMKQELNVMLKQGYGAIVNNSSVDGQRAFPPDPVYSAAKHGVLGLTKSAAVQYADKGIRINAVCPGWIRTPANEEWLANDPGIEARLLLHQPINRMGRAEEVASAVLWLCSDASSLVTGTALAVDGGYLAI